MNDNDNDKKYLMDEESAKKYQKTVDSFHIPAFYKLLIKEGKLTEAEYFEKLLPEKRLKKIEKQIAELEKKQTHAIDNQVVFNKGIMEQIAELKEFDKGSQKWSVLIETILRDLIEHIHYDGTGFDFEGSIDYGCKKVDGWKEKLDVGSARQTDCLLNKPHASSVEIERRLAEKCRCLIHRKTEKKEDKSICKKCGRQMNYDIHILNSGGYYCPYCLKDSGGIDKSDNSLYLSFQCPNCNHRISIKKEDINVN